MKRTINKYQFRDAFKAVGRGASFSYAGLDALFDFFEEVNPDFELDPVAIDCDFSQHESAFHCMNYYMTSDQFIDEFIEAMNEGDDALEEACLEYLRENTCVIEFTGGIIIQAF